MPLRVHLPSAYGFCLTCMRRNVSPMLSAGPHGDHLLNFLRRESTKHNGGDKHRAIISLMEEVLCSRSVQRQAHAQITLRVHQWEVDFVRMALSFPLLTHLDLTAATLVIAPGEGRSSSLRHSPTHSSHPHSWATHSAGDPSCSSHFCSTHSAPGPSQADMHDAQADAGESGYTSGLSVGSPLASAGASGSTAYPFRPAGDSLCGRGDAAAETWGAQPPGPDATRVLHWLSLEDRHASLFTSTSGRLDGGTGEPMSANPTAFSLHIRIPGRVPSTGARLPHSSPGRLGMTWPPTRALSSAHPSASHLAEAGPSGSKRKAAQPIMQSHAPIPLQASGSGHQPTGHGGSGPTHATLKRYAKEAAAERSGVRSSDSGSDPFWSGSGAHARGLGPLSSGSDSHASGSSPRASEWGSCRTGRLPAPTGPGSRPRIRRPDSPCRVHRGWYSAHVVADTLPLEASLLTDVLKALPRLQHLSFQLARVIRS